MRILLDTNILIRLAQPGTSACSSVLTALEQLELQQFDYCIVPQVIYEFWVVATRPLDQNGLGIRAAQASLEIARISTLFTLLRDERAVFEQWVELVTQYKVEGKTAHDARLVAAMQRHHIEHLLTFNVKDFKRYTHITLHAPSAFHKHN